MIYKRRHPEITEYNRILEANFEAFERNYQNKMSSAKKAHYEVFEFMVFLAGHLLSPYETITYYYGIYSSSYRGKERKEKRGESPMEREKIKRKPEASASWARLIHKIFEVDPQRLVR